MAYEVGDNFAKIVETLDARDASFVSVTQQFNTTTSIGRFADERGRLTAATPAKNPRHRARATRPLSNGRSS